MFKNGANTAMDLKTFGNSNANVNSDVLIRLDSGGDPTPGTNSGKITYNINGLDRHIMTATGLCINTTGPGIFALNVNGDSLLSNNLNVSGTTKISNNTTLFSSLNVSGFTLLNNNTTLLSSFNISGFTTLNNNVSIISSLNVSGFTTLNNNVSIISSLNISGFTTLNNNVSIISSLNVSGRTIIGSDIYNYNDSVLELYKNITVRKNVTDIYGTFIGDNIAIKAGEGNNSSYISLVEGGNINIQTQNYATSNAVITLTSNKFINMNTPETVISNNLTINGTVKGANLGVKSPIFFTTNRTITINGDIFSIYDLNLSKYTKSVLLDGYTIRQFRIRHWPASADFEYSSTFFNEMYLKRYDIFMSNRNGLSIFSLSSPVENYYLRETKIGSHFLYRKDFNYITFCSKGSTPVKVYLIIEDLL
jgi:hypothetical protein